MQNGLADLAQTAHRLNPALEALGPVTFRPSAAAREDWNAWCDQVWLPLLGPALKQAMAFSRSGCLRELADLDLGLNERLGSELAPASSTAGRHLLQAAGVLRGEKSVRRFAEWRESGRATGHLLTVHALRAAAFSATDPQAFGSYLYQEAVGGLFPNHPALVGECVEAALRSESAALPILRVA